METDADMQWVVCVCVMSLHLVTELLMASCQMHFKQFYYSED